MNDWIPKEFTSVPDAIAYIHEADDKITFLQSQAEIAFQYLRGVDATLSKLSAADRQALRLISRPCPRLEAYDETVLHGLGILKEVIPNFRGSGGYIVTGEESTFINTYFHNCSRAVRNQLLRELHASITAESEKYPVMTLDELIEELGVYDEEDED